MKDLEFTNNERVELIYDIFAGILSVIATLVVVLQFNGGIQELHLKYLNTADKVIYFIFLLDISVRIFFSKDKKKYVKGNIFDLIAIIPFGFFTNSPFGSALKLVKVMVYLLRLIHNLKDLLYTNGFIYSLGCTGIITVLGSFAVYFFEKGNSPSIKTYGDAFWWSFVTVTTVGYGDISPTTTIGRAIACILMLSGIGFLSMLTSTVSTYFLMKTQSRKEAENNRKYEEERSGTDALDISDLNPEQKKQLLQFYEFIKVQKS